MDADEEKLISDATDAEAFPMLAAKVRPTAEMIDTDPPSPAWILDGAIERGDVVALVAKSKMRKSFFSLQLAICVASGRDFIGMNASEAHRVLLVDYENKQDWLHRRFRRMASGLFGGDVPNDAREKLEANLSLMSLRGESVSVETVLRYADAMKAELLILDPLYCAAEGMDENSIKEMGQFLKTLQDATKSGLAVLVVHHDTKGKADEKDKQDTGAGSSVFMRKVELGINILPWKGEGEDSPENLAVVRFVTRNVPHEDMTVEFSDGGYFVARDDLHPYTKKPTATEKRPKVDLSEVENSIAEYCDEHPLSATEMILKLTKTLGLTEIAARATKDKLVNEGRLVTWKDGKKGNGCLIGTPRLKERLEAATREGGAQ